MDILCPQRRTGIGCTAALPAAALPRPLPKPPRPARGAFLALLGAALVLAGCSPALNWRVTRLDAAPVQALMPCKPERAEREVALQGPSGPAATLRMMSCDSAGLTFAVSAVRLPEAGPATAYPAALMDRWQLATWASLRQTPVTSTSAENAATLQAPDGWMPLLQPVRGAELQRGWQGPGLAHDGQALQARFVLAQRAGWLVQAAVYGPGWSAETGETFFGGLALE